MFLDLLFFNNKFLRNSKKLLHPAPPCHPGTPRQGRAGQGRAGPGRAGQGRAGEGGAAVDWREGARVTAPGAHPYLGSARTKRRGTGHGCFSEEGLGQCFQAGGRGGHGDGMGWERRRVGWVE